MESLLIRNGLIVNEQTIQKADVHIRWGRIVEIGHDLHPVVDHTIDADGLHLLPGLIDDQVHFREPGLTAKGDLQSESRAAVAGGITSYMEMPNTSPPTLTQDLLEWKYERAAQVSVANYSFYLGASNDNIEEVKRTDPRRVCGIKVFMGSSTGNMLVDEPLALERIFAESPTLIATHCESEAIIRANAEKFRTQYGNDLPAHYHPIIRSDEGCIRSSSFAVDLAKQFGSRLHVLHISTARELELFRSNLPLAEKKITAEACIHHLWFYDRDYDRLGNRIKWNPAIKTRKDRDAILQAVNDGTIDVIATDHAPHTKEEKMLPYFQCPSGGPLVQHGLLALLDLHHKAKLSLETIVQKTSHNVAELFRIQERGYIREGYWADLVLVDLHKPQTVRTNNLLYKCGWSPFEGHTFRSSVAHTLVNGQLVYSKGKVDEDVRGQRLLFDR